MLFRFQWGFCCFVWDSSFDACSSLTTERAVSSRGPVAPALCHQLNGSCCQQQGRVQWAWQSGLTAQSEGSA